MASGTYSRSTPPPVQGTTGRGATSTSSAESERYVVEQLDRAGRYLKLVEFFGALLVLGVAVLAFLLAVAVVDAWIVELGYWARLGALVILAGGSLVYVCAFMLPLVWRRINPAYAARTIERSEPSLKNSLINFLSFRTHREGLHRRVYDALQQRAATDLSHTPVESAIDYSRLLNIGYVLAGLLLVCGLYTVLSPKKPFATLQRIVSPLSEVARPSVVQIERVEPGNTEAFHGDRVTVSASIRGLPSDQPATLWYSTADGQTVDAQVPMLPDKHGARHYAELPPGDDGLQQDVRYHLEAGDARTPEYTIRMIPAPRINVREVHYEYPEYTGLPARTVEDEADIQAVEGTRVTIRAHANQPIRGAFIELVPPEGGDDARPVSVSMRHEGQDAVGSFVLSLQADRRTPRYGSYQVRFRTTTNHLSRMPTVHRIEVTRDLPPEVEILTPELNRIQVPIDGEQIIEVRALDPDFGLSRVALRAEVAGAELFDENLLVEPAGRTGQFSTRFKFVPATLKGLVPGNEVVYWAIAEDNRTTPDRAAAKEKRARTENFFIEIVDAPGPREEDEKKDDAGGEPEEKSAEEKSSDEKKDDSSSRDGDARKDDEGASGEKSDDEKSDGEKSSDESGEGSSKQSGGGENGSSGGSSGSENSKGSESGAAGGSSSDSASSSNASQGDNSRGSSSGQGGGSSAAEGGDSAAGQPSSGGEGEGDSRTEPLHDGEVFERTLEHLRKRQGGEDSGESSQAGGDSNQGEPNDASAGGESGGEKSGEEKADRAQGDGDNGGAEKSGGQTDNNSSGQGGSRQPNGSGGQGSQSKPDGGSAAQQSPSGGSNNQGGQPKPDGGQGEQPMGGGDNAQQRPAGDSQGENPSGSGQGGQQQKPNGGEQGGQPQGGSQAGGQSQQQNSSGGGGESQSGSQGEKKQGRQQGAGGGSTQAQGENRQRQNGGGSSGGNQPMNGGGAQSPSGSQKQSSGQGEEGGDKSGGGTKGGGQDGDQSGQGNAGDGASSDEGSGAANEPGDGETSRNPGGSKQGKTGSGNRSGKGAGSGGQSGSTADQGGGKQPGDRKAEQGQPGEREDGQQRNTGGEKRAGGEEGAERKTTSGESSGESRGSESRSSKSGSNNAGRNPSGGGASPSGGADGVGGGDSPAAPEAEAPDADKANLEYTKQATDLALEYLRDQKDKPDRELLDDLDMTKEELEEFVNRWEAMKRGAREAGPSGEGYSDALRSLGLRPHSDKRRAARAADDAVRGVDSGARSEPPPSFIEQFRAFKSGAARAESERADAK